MTASVLKQDWNTQKRFKQTFILIRTHGMHILREIPLIKPQNDT